MVRENWDSSFARISCPKIGALTWSRFKPYFMEDLGASVDTLLTRLDIITRLDKPDSVALMAVALLAVYAIYRLNMPAALQGLSP